MAEGKKSFIGYAEWIDTFEVLSDQDAGKLIKHLLMYVNDQNPETDNILIKAVFANMKSTLKRDLKKWNDRLESKKHGAATTNLKRWYSDIYDTYKSGAITLETALKLAKNRKASLSDKSESLSIDEVAVNDNVNVNVNVSSKLDIAHEVFDLEDEIKPLSIKNSKPIIPSWEEFRDYANEKSRDLDQESLKNKYDAWKEAGWRSGKDQRKIKVWKTTLLNTLQYINKSSKTETRHNTSNASKFADAAL